MSVSGLVLEFVDVKVVHGEPETKLLEELVILRAAELVAEHLFTDGLASLLLLGETSGDEEHGRGAHQLNTLAGAQGDVAIEVVDESSLLARLSDGPGRHLLDNGGGVVSVSLNSIQLPGDLELQPVEVAVSRQEVEEALMANLFFPCALT